MDNIIRNLRQDNKSMDLLIRESKFLDAEY